jgi:hypothetical protein
MIYLFFYKASKVFVGYKQMNWSWGLLNSDSVLKTGSRRFHEFTNASGSKIKP